MKFNESERPSFVELGKLVLTSTDNSIDSPKGEKAASRKSLGMHKKSIGGTSKTFSVQKLKDINQEEIKTANVDMPEEP